jgi:hypothetical protein
VSIALPQNSSLRKPINKALLQLMKTKNWSELQNRYIQWDCMRYSAVCCSASSWAWLEWSYTLRILWSCNKSAIPWNDTFDLLIPIPFCKNQDSTPDTKHKLLDKPKLIAFLR